MMIQVLFFDIGGVILTNGWDKIQRGEVFAKFDLNPEEIEALHDRYSVALDTGEIGLDQYLDKVVFTTPRPFSREDFIDEMKAQSQLLGETRNWLKAFRQKADVRIFALNNEGLDLNRHRIETFALKELFGAFLSSCYLGLAKPDTRVFERALEIVQCKPAEVVVIDDRFENIESAQDIGMITHHFQNLAGLRAFLNDQRFHA